MNFYKRHIGDYLKDTAHLTLLEHGIYSRLLDVYYTREAGIPDAQAARLIGARSKDECESLKVVLGEFFELVDGSWIQARCEREIEGASAQAKANQENGKKGGRPKAKSNPEPNRNETEEEPNGFQFGSYSETENNLSQTPDSRLQTPEEKTPSAPSEKISLGDDGKWAGIPERLSTSWHEAYPAVNVPAELAKAAAWVIANPKNRKSNYARFLTNWLTRAQDTAKPVRVANGSSSGDYCNPNDKRYVN